MAGLEAVRTRKIPPTRSTEAAVTVLSAVDTEKMESGFTPMVCSSDTLMTMSCAPVSVVALRALEWPAPARLDSLGGHSLSSPYAALSRLKLTVSTGAALGACFFQACSMVSYTWWGKGKVVTGALVALLISCRRGMAEAGLVIVAVEIMVARKVDMPPDVTDSVSSGGFEVDAAAALADLHWAGK